MDADLILCDECLNKKPKTLFREISYFRKETGEPIKMCLWCEVVALEDELEFKKWEVQSLQKDLKKLSSTIIKYLKIILFYRGGAFKNS